jgi:hypothetical protein
MHCSHSQKLRIAVGIGLLLATGLSDAQDISSVTAGANTNSAAPAQDARVWRFKVFLDDKEIGWHSFELNPAAGSLLSQARYNVKILFINAYTYVHNATETWDGACLARIQAYTDDNGKLSTVQGRRNGKGFEVTAGTGQARLPECVQSFAYWDASILRATHLLNAQTGEYVPLRMIPLGKQAISVRGQRVLAEAWRIQAKAMQIDLWYSSNNDWLALQSVTEGGRTLRYQIQ